MKERVKEEEGTDQLTHRPRKNREIYEYFSKTEVCFI